MSAPEPKHGARQASPLRLLVGVAVVALALCGSFGGYAMIADHLVDEADRDAPRDPSTGILLSAESKWLGPEDADKAVLLVHGFIGAGQNFGGLPELLADKGWRVHVMRLPGHGTSPRDLIEVTPEELLAAVRQETQALMEKHGTVVLIGHSMGGTLCVLTAADLNVSGVVLAAPYFEVTRKWYYLLPAEQWQKLTAPCLHWLYKGKVFLQVNRKEAKDDILSYEWVHTKSVGVLMELGQQAGQTQLLEGVTCPVLMLHGTGDVAASPKAARQAFELLGSTDKRFVSLSRSSHHIFFDYDREQVLDEIGRFVEAR